MVKSTADRTSAFETERPSSRVRAALPGKTWCGDQISSIRKRDDLFRRSVARKPDAEEHDIAVRSVTIGEFERMMLEGVIRDGCTQAAWALYLMWKTRQG